MEALQTIPGTGQTMEHMTTTAKYKTIHTKNQEHTQ